MAHPANPQIHYAELDMSRFTDTDRANILADVVEASKTSPLGANAPIQTAVTALVTLGANVVTTGNVVIADRTKLANDLTTWAGAQGTFDKGLLLLKNLVQDAATSAAEVQSMAFKVRGAKKILGPMLVPVGVDVRFGKKVHGYLTVSARATGSFKRWAAQISVNPIGPATWVNLAGDAKSHKITGYPSGTSLWVRYATVRGHDQSDWCTPVLVTIP